MDRDRLKLLREKETFDGAGLVEMWREVWNKSKQIGLKQELILHWTARVKKTEDRCKGEAGNGSEEMKRQYEFVGFPDPSFLLYL